MLTFELLEPRKDLNKALDELTEKFAPLYAESWAREKAKVRDYPPYDINIGVFSNLWFSKTMKIIIAYRDGQATGFMVGMVFRPLQYQATVFQVEDWYIKDGTPTDARDLFNYMESMLTFLGTDELWVEHGEREDVPHLPRWERKGNTITTRYVKSD